MDQISDKKNKEDRWVEKLSLSDAMKRLNKRENHIIQPVSYTHLITVFAGNDQTAGSDTEIVLLQGLCDRCV